MVKISHVSQKIGKMKTVKKVEKEPNGKNWNLRGSDMIVEIGVGG